MQPSPASQDITKGRDIVCLGFAEWDTELWTNQHHLMARLAAENRVLFIESLGLRRPTIGARDLKRIFRRLVAGVRPPRTVPSPYGGTLTVLSPLVLPLHTSSAVRRINRAILRMSVRVAQRRAFGARDRRRQRVLWAYVPQAEALVRTVRPDVCIYHCVDDIAEQDGIDSVQFRRAEQAYLRISDLVLASAPRLWSRLEAVHGNVVRAPNVADTDLFASALSPGPVDVDLAAVGAPRIVFTGAIAEKKLDFKLLMACAARRPTWQFILVGGVGVGDPSTDVSGLSGLPNVHILKTRAYSELPSVLRGADVGIIPYRRSSLTDSVFPMKVYEYLAAGLPVVATDLPALAGVQDVVTASGAEEFVRAVEDALATSPEARHARSRSAAEHSWSNRLLEIESALAAFSHTGNET